MSVLIEALSLVVPRTALIMAWPGGPEGFMRAMCEDKCPARWVCADDALVSASFFSPDEALRTAHELTERGLIDVLDDRFVDLAFVEQGIGPTMPCPWLDWRAHRDGFSYAWLQGTDPTTMATPADWTPEQSRRLVRSDLRDDPDRMFLLGSDGEFEEWLDFQTGQISRGLGRRSQRKTSAP